MDTDEHRYEENGMLEHWSEGRENGVTAEAGSSVAPSGACFISRTFPTADAVGYLLALLRSSSGRNRRRSRSGVATTFVATGVLRALAEEDTFFFGFGDPLVEDFQAVGLKQGADAVG